MFAAAETVILRDGAGALRGRAVTAQAGVATGLLHAHFGDFDAFLEAYVVDRSFLLAGESAALAQGVAEDGRSVSDALADGLAALPRREAGALVRLLAARPDLVARAADTLGEEASGFAGVTGAVAERLTAERAAGRLAPGAAPAPLAYAVVAVLQRAWCEGLSEAHWRAILTAQLAGFTVPQS